MSNAHRRLGNLRNQRLWQFKVLDTLRYEVLLSLGGNRSSIRVFARHSSGGSGTKAEIPQTIIHNTNLSLSPMSNPTQSYHLPDLLGIISTIPLRTNPHCKPASQSSEKRVLDLGVLGTREAELVHPTKVGLLVALCFPTCDRPQLTLLSEAGMWLLVSGIRSTEESNQAGSWSGLGDEADNEQLDALEMLKRHELLQQLRMFLLYSLLYKCLIF